MVTIVQTDFQIIAFWFAEFAPQGPVGNKQALVHIMAWRLTDCKP